MEKYDVIIIGAGITGITLANLYANKNKKVLILEKNNHIGGNCYDYFQKKNYIQEYGPHIFHTKYQEVYDYLSQFTDWHKYNHEVLGFIDNNLVPIPFNLNSIDLTFNNNKELKELLIKEIGKENKISILDLLNKNNKKLVELGQYVYNKVFLNYTKKQWDVKPEEIDKSVTSRVPVFISRDNRYFQDEYQGIPKKGFTRMLEKMLENQNISIKLNYKFDIDNLEYEYDKLYYTGPMDEFFNYKYGRIKYRKIEIKKELINQPIYQVKAVINYPNDYDFTRITETNHFLNIRNKDTIIMKEFPSWDKGFIAYPVQDAENKIIIERYKEEISKLNNIYFRGRLAECQYFNIDQAIKNILDDNL